MTHNNYMSGLR